MEKINIDQRYPESIEAGRSDDPYRDFLSVIKHVFNLNACESVIDVGCASGNLISLMKREFNHLDVSGVEYFDYHKNYAPKEIVEKINFIDIRDPLPPVLSDRKFDIVICTEVGEHIDPAFCDQFLENIKSLVGKILIMTWSSHGGLKEPEFDPYHQHLNPLTLDEFISLMSSKGFMLDPTSSIQLVEKSYEFKNFFHWWRESMTVWTVNK